jgi:hypothetical protein
MRMFLIIFLSLSLSLLSCRHTTRDILDELPALGLVINLTNTKSDTKYYQPQDWLSNGIDYERIAVEGA